MQDLLKHLVGINLSAQSNRAPLNGKFGNFFICFSVISQDRIAFWAKTNSLVDDVVRELGFNVANLARLTRTLLG